MLKEQIFRNFLTQIFQPKTLNLHRERERERERERLTGVKYVMFSGFRDLRRFVGGSIGRRSAIDGVLGLGEG